MKNTGNINAQMGRLLRALASRIERFGVDEVVNLIESQDKLRNGKVENAASIRTELGLRPVFDVEKLADNLNSLGTREEGVSLLTSASLTRKELEILSRRIGVPVLKSDNMERLSEKIIETSIGSRLSSEAIRGDRKT